MQENPHDPRSPGEDENGSDRGAIFIPEKRLKFGTRCVHAGEGHNPFGAHATPIYQTSTYVFESADAAAEIFSGAQGYRYIRSPPHTPTHAAFIEKICSLEGGKAGLAFSSGMAAETAMVLSQLKAGDHLLSTDVIYGGTYGLFSTLLPRYGIEVSFVDTTDPEQVLSALQENTRMVFLESPANPTLAVCDIPRICKMAREAGAVCCGGQHLRHSLFPAASGPGRRRRGGELHQVHRRPWRPAGGSGGELR